MAVEEEQMPTPTIIPTLPLTLAAEWLEQLNAARDLWDAYDLSYGPEPVGMSRETVAGLRDALLTALSTVEEGALLKAA
jgi:hypothetical protein